MADSMTSQPDELTPAPAGAEAGDAGSDAAQPDTQPTAETPADASPVAGAAPEAPRPDTPSGPRPFAAPDFETEPEPSATAGIELLDDVELDVKVELGRSEMYIEDVLRLGVGSVVELNKLAGDPVDVYVNDRLFARGEVLVLNDSFCVRINDILSPVPELDDPA